MLDPVIFSISSVTISVLSLAVSAITAWLTFFRCGTVKMTQPTMIFFGPDKPRDSEDIPFPKVYLRTLLFSTSKRGRIIESMHVSLSRNETHQTFNIWVHGDTKLVRVTACLWEKMAFLQTITFILPRMMADFDYRPEITG